jgi:hypothetical protein
LEACKYFCPLSVCICNLFIQFFLHFNIFQVADELFIHYKYWSQFTPDFDIFYSIKTEFYVVLLYNFKIIFYDKHFENIEAKHATELISFEIQCFDSTFVDKLFKSVLKSLRFEKHDFCLVSNNMVGSHSFITIWSLSVWSITWLASSKCPPPNSWLRKIYAVCVLRMVNSWPVVKYSYTWCVDNFRFCLSINKNSRIIRFQWMNQTTKRKAPSGRAVSTRTTRKDQSPGRGPRGRIPPHKFWGFEELQTFNWTTILN